MEVTTIGLDLGKDVFQVHGITADGTVVFNRTIRRRQLLKFFEAIPRCLVGIEACGSAHHWARELIEIGHDVRLMPAVYVKPYVKRGKTDAVDAEAICEAVTRPTMRFVAVKSKEQQALLTIHRVRQLVVRQKTQMLNVIRVSFESLATLLVTDRSLRCASSKLLKPVIARIFLMLQRACLRRSAIKLLHSTNA